MQTKNNKGRILADHQTVHATEQTQKEFLTVPELAKIIGLSRSHTFRKVKGGDIPAQKVGRMFLVSKDVAKRIEKEKQKKDEEFIESAVKKILEDYGEVLQKLGRDEKPEFDSEFKKWTERYVKKKGVK